MICRAVILVLLVFTTVHAETYVLEGVTMYGDTLCTYVSELDSVPDSTILLAGGFVPLRDMWISTMPTTDSGTYYDYRMVVLVSSHETPCDMDHNGIRDIGDLVLLIDWMFHQEASE